MGEGGCKGGGGVGGRERQKEEREQGGKQGKDSFLQTREEI